MCPRPLRLDRNQSPLVLLVLAVASDDVRLGEAGTLHGQHSSKSPFNEGVTFESFISTMPGSIYAGPVSGVMTWPSNQFNRLVVRGTWAYTAP